MRLVFAVSLWQRFVTLHREDQDLITSHFSSQPGQFCPIVSNYAGNPQAVITHPKGEAQQYERYKTGSWLTWLIAELVCIACDSKHKMLRAELAFLDERQFKGCLAFALRLCAEVHCCVGMALHTPWIRCLMHHLW